MSNNRQRKNRSKVHIKEITMELGNRRLSFLLSDMIQIFMAVIACLSFIGVLLTLNEMRKDRDAAYKPAVLMNATNFQISWDANGEENWLLSLPKKSDGNYEVNEDGSITGTFSLPVNIFPNGELESFTAVNIGIGTARDICFEWDQNNLPLPMACSILIHEIVKCASLPENLYIVLYVEYSDIQGTRSRDTIYISINRTYFENDVDGSGTATYQLAPSLLTE